MAFCDCLSDFSYLSSPCPPAVDAPVGGLAEEEEFRDVISGYCEKQL